MARLARCAFWVAILVLAGCGKEEPSPVVAPPPPPPGWPMVECPMGSTVKAVDRLTEIENWAATESPDAKTKATACKSHTGVNEIHCAKVYAAWTAAKATQQPLLTPAQKTVLWAVCVSELTHGTGGGVAQAAGAPVWPDVECPELSGRTARQRLDEIIGWAVANLDAQTKATACRDTHTGVNPLHCERVYAAWVYASTTQLPGLTPEDRAVLWILCVSELTHGTGGGAREGG